MYYPFFGSIDYQIIPFSTIEYLKISEVLKMTANQEQRSVHRIKVINTTTGQIIGECETGKALLPEIVIYLRTIIPCLENYKFSVIHYTEEEYHTRILLREKYFVEDIEFEDVKYRVTIYNIPQQQPTGFFGRIANFFKKVEERPQESDQGSEEQFICSQEEPLSNNAQIEVPIYQPEITPPVYQSFSYSANDIY